MKYEIEPYHRDVPDEELLADLRRVATEIGKNRITTRDYNERGSFNSTTFFKRFGSWNAAVDKAGLIRAKHHKIPDEDLFSNLAELWATLGRQPRHGELRQRKSRFGARTYENRFGTWRKALEAFVRWANEGEPTPAPEKNAVPPPESESASAPDKGARNAGRKTPRNPNYRLKFLVLMRDGNRCKVCGGEAGGSIAELHFDHIKPWSKGGETVLENLQILCDKCNLGKGNWEPQN